MNGEPEKTLESGWVGDIQIQSEDIAYKPEQLIGCKKCGKPNPPSRTECFYCSASLGIEIEKSPFAKLTGRELESWEKGYNIIAMPDDADVNRAEIARFLSLEGSTVDRILDEKREVPIARLESFEKAEAAIKALKNFGLSCLIVGDEVLQPATLPVRLRSIAFRDRSLVLGVFNTGALVSIEYDSLNLIVLGAIFESKTELQEKRKRKERTLLNETQMTSDELVIDLYSSEDENGFRIPRAGFDFSCLDSGKSILAAENMLALVNKLRVVAPNAVFDNAYVELREYLDSVWEVTSRRDSFGLQRSGFANTAFTQVATRSNLEQFTKYSRLRRHLI